MYDLSWVKRRTRIGGNQGGAGSINDSVGVGRHGGTNGLVGGEEGDDGRDSSLKQHFEGGKGVSELVCSFFVGD